MARTVIAAARQFGSDRGDTGLVADITDLSSLTQSRHASLKQVPLLATNGSCLRLKSLAGLPVRRATDLQNRAVRTVEMLPANATGMLNVTYEIDASGKHSIARDIEIVDPERDHRASSEEGMRTIGEPEPYQVIGLPSDWHPNDIPEQRNGFV